MPIRFAADDRAAGARFRLLIEFPESQRSANGCRQVVSNGRVGLVDIIPKVISEKPTIPTIWLDTSVVIKITKIAQGEALQEIEIERLTRLKTLVEELVGAGKLLCPESDQEEEYVAGRLDNEVHASLLELSLGIRLQHRQGCFDYQVQKGMKAYVTQAETINVPLLSYFYSDPIEELTAARRRPFLIGANMFKDTEILTRRRSAKTEVQEIWERLRQEFVAKGRTYAEQLDGEQRGYADALVNTIEEFERKLHFGSIGFWDIMSAEGFLCHKVCWKNLGGNPEGMSGLHKFFCSTYYNCLPIARIHAQIGADLLTGNQPILSGDMMDVELLSVAVPVSHFVLTDKKMADRIKRLGIDKEWKTEVFSMSEVDGLFERLEALR